MKKTLLLFCACITMLATQAQDVNFLNTLMEDFKLSILQQPHDFDSPKFEQMYNGSPFLEKEWQSSTIELSDGQAFTCLMRYFVYADQFWIKKENNEITSLTISPKINSLQLGERRFEYQTYLVDGKPKTGLIEAIYKSTLFKTYSCTLVKGQEVSGYQEKEKDLFKIKSMLYYKIDDNQITALPQNKKELFSIFGDKKAKMENYFKAKKMKIKDESDIIQLFAHFDTLTQ